MRGNPHVRFLGELGVRKDPGLTRRPAYRDRRPKLLRTDLNEEDRVFSLH
jgi:hypothetical protein